ncbi:MAG: substrate-binding protein [Herbinix sp.]|jgi:ribose transport system substrate-binding protein|nr:substrate-binding protein [Herbinix sp.]
MKRKVIFVILISILFLLAIGKGGYQVYLNSSQTSLNIIYIPKEMKGSDFWSSVIAGAETAATENGVNLKVMAPEKEADIEVQNRIILEAIKKKPDAICVSPISSDENLPALRKVKEAGIKLVYIDSITSEQLQDAIVATDNYEAGRKMGEFINNTIVNTSKIAIISHMKGSSTATQREEGLRQALGNKASQIVDVGYSNSDYDIAYKEAVKILKKYDINYLACLNEYSAIGAARAVKDLGLEGKLTLIGFDSSIEEIKLLEEGVFSVIVVQRAYSMGYLGIETTVNCIRSKNSGISIDSGSILITKDNMYDVENQEVLFPFYGK